MAVNSVYRSSLFAETAKHEAGNRALMTIYHRLYLKALREERRLELASVDQAKPDPEIPAGEGFTDGEESEGAEL